MRSVTRLTAALVGIIMIGLILGCQENPLAPTSQEEAGNFRLVKASPEQLGLARGSLTMKAHATRRHGAVLSIAGNYILIPGGALEKDMNMTFTISLTNNNELLFQVEGEGVPSGEHIYFQRGKQSTVAISKKWLAETPNIGINVDTREQYTVRTTPTHYIFQVPHFTAYGWAITD